MNKSNETRFLIVRLIVFGLLIAIQMAWILVIIEGLLSYSVLLNIVLSLLSFLIILYLLNKDDSPAYRMSWIILIALFPLLGSLFYLFAGNKRPLKEMTRRIQNQVENHREDRQTVPDALPILKHRSNRLSSIAKYVSDFAGMPVLVNQEVDYYPNGESVMDDLVADLKAAKSHIFLEFFIIEEGQMYNQIFDVLKQKAKEGVDVRLIYDDFGCLLRLNDSFVEDMARYGIKALKFNPVRPIVSLVYNTRDHRKYIIIDNEVAYTGGVNIADEYINRKNRFGYWKDTMIRVKGGAVWNYAYMFLLLWNAYKNEDFDFTKFDHLASLDQSRQALEENPNNLSFVQPFSDSPLDSEPLGENVYREILNAAEDYVYIYTPYLVISYELQTAMILAAKRGVDVRLMTPGIPDKKMVYRITRSYYRPLIEGGVQIYEYLPGFLHAKSFVSDDRVAIVGTINLDYRSLYLHFETGTLLYFHPQIKAIKADFLEAQEEGKRIREKHLRRTVFGKITDALLRLLAPFV